MMKGTIHQKKNKTDYFEKCKSCESKSDWIQFCIEEKVSFPYMETIWESSHVKRPSTLYQDDVFDETMVQSLRDFRWIDNDLKSLVINGSPGCGKTNWAKKHSKKPSLFVSHLDRLKDFDDAFHKSIIFDDMDFNHLPRTSQIHLVDRENPRDVHIRYRVAHIPSKIQKIFTTNGFPFTADNAIKRRTEWFFVDNQIQ